MDPQPAAVQGEAKGREGDRDGLRQRILGAAFEAFARSGFAQTSTLEIASRAHVSKRELYVQFGSKENLLIASIAARAALLCLPADFPVARTAAQFHAALEEIGVILLREWCDAPVAALYRLAIAEADRSPEIARQVQEHVQRPGRAAVRELIERAQWMHFLAAGNAAEMAEDFTSLLLRDTILGLALGLESAPDPALRRARARAAASAFLLIHVNSEAA